MQHANRHQIQIEAALLTFFRTLLWAGKTILGQPVNPDTQLTINFDDSYISATETRRQQDKDDCLSGFLPKYRYNMEWRGMSEEDARAAVQEAAEEGLSDNDLLLRGFLMLSPKWLARCTAPIAELYAQAESSILDDMARRISTYDFYIPAAQYQEEKLAMMGMTRQQIIAELSKRTGARLARRSRRSWRPGRKKPTTVMVQSMSRQGKRYRKKSAPKCGESSAPA